MKLLSKAFILLTLTGFILDADAKQIKLTFNQSTEEESKIENYLKKGALDIPKQSSDIKERYIQQIEVKNCGSQVVENCLPYTTQAPFNSLESLAKYLSEKEQPLHALYALWTETICPVDEDDELGIDPLYILNFKGYCHKDHYVDHFVTLCHQLGISTRQIAHKGKKCYDFYFQGRWEMLDPRADLMVLGLDNQRVVASDDILDDPFLALRSKHCRYDQANLEQSWKELARFEIVNPTYKPETCGDNLGENEYPNIGFDLHSQEKIFYRHTSLPNQYEVEHIINPIARIQGTSIYYTSPFPIREISNQTDGKISVKTLNAEIEPGSTLAITDPHLFSVEMEVAAMACSGTIHCTSCCSKIHFPAPSNENRVLSLGSEHNPSTIEVTVDLNDEIENSLSKVIKVKNISHTFDHCTPSFELASDGVNEKIWWQISITPDFSFIPPNFEEIQNHSDHLVLPILTDTFFNADDTYYFRVKGYSEGRWTDWSETFPFLVLKPDPIADVELDKLDDGQFQLSWEGDTDSDTEFLVFGSNSLDFIPSIYSTCTLQAVANGEVIAIEKGSNLQVVTRETKCIVDGSLAYYRIIVRKHGQLSVPSHLIYVYDNDLDQHRDVLQVVEMSDEREVAKRILIPTTYSKTGLRDLLPLPTHPKPTLSNLANMIARQAEVAATPTYVRTKYVTPEIWAKVRPYLLPENHPVKPKLDRLFSRSRVTLTNKTFKEAGFKRNRIGRFSRVMASSNPELPGVFIKAFADTELYVTIDWYKWIHRIEGSKAVRACLHSHNYQHKFKVPHKWIYPLPADPSPPNSEKYLRKNFILVAEDMQIYEHEKNNDLYKKKITTEQLDALYTILQEVGLWDSCYAFNIPFSKDGKLAVVDTEYFHKWPVPFEKFTKYFSKSKAKYWEKLIKQGGPKPKTEKAN